MVSVGQRLLRVPLSEVLCLNAADKYVRVLTAEHEYLIRTPLKDLLPRLDPQQFWPIHRSTVVQVPAIAHISRDAQGRQTAHLLGLNESFAISRLHAHRFRAM